MEELRRYITDHLEQSNSTLIQGDHNQLLKIETLIINGQLSENPGKRDPNYYVGTRLHYINCDRKEIMRTFRDYFGHTFEKKTPPFYFFVLPSFQFQQGNSLIERMALSLKEIGNRSRKVYFSEEKTFTHPHEAGNQFPIVDLPFGSDEAGSRYAFNEAFCRALKVVFPTPEITLENFTLHHFASCQSPAHLRDIVVLPYKITLDDLKKKYVINHLKWIATRFCDRNCCSPFFVFFLQLYIPQYVAGNSISRYLSRIPFLRQNQDLERVFEKLKEIENESPYFKILPFLSSINLADMDDWLSHHIPNEAHRLKLLKELFAETGKKMNIDRTDRVYLHMADAEFIIAHILNKLQNERNPL